MAELLGWVPPRRARFSPAQGITAIAAESHSGALAKKAATITYRLLRWGHDRVPLGVRSIVGVLFMIGGVFGILPLLGFWMFPLGAALIALDIPWTRHKIHNWMDSLKAKVEP